MKQRLVYVAAAGIVSPLGWGLDETEEALCADRSAIAPLEIFSPLQGKPLPVGQVKDLDSSPVPPRAHRLAREAARMALHGQPEPPDAIVLGCTTGGILTTEELLRNKEHSPECYHSHGLLSLVEDIANLCHCTGPALTVSTACSSGAVAIALALNLLRTGQARRVLAGGVDSLSRLTYYGFHSLQLVDRKGCRPLDASRQGLAVAEGAAMLLLTTEQIEQPLACLLGAGLSCDAYHPTAPHPEGKGARAAMQAAIEDAGLAPEDIDYINLHGTGTPDNDLAEARAIASLFASPPQLSSIKGATGHSLAAAGAIEAVVSCLAISRGLVPGTVGCSQPDPAFVFTPEMTCVQRPVRTVLSNSFGFGGNNGSLVFGDLAHKQLLPHPSSRNAWLAIHGIACLTGKGLLQATFAHLQEGGAAGGRFPDADLAQRLPARLIRRIKRLTRIAMLLSGEVQNNAEGQDAPGTVFMGTGWGALSETWDFLQGLEDSGEEFPSPTDFVGSVHNGPAGQVAMLIKATGANVTCSGGDYSFEQALLAAQTLLPETGQSAMLLGADEAHAKFTPLLDRSIGIDGLTDGGGGVYVNRDREQAKCLVRLVYYGRGGGDDLPDRLFAALGGVEYFHRHSVVVFAGVPAAMQAESGPQLERFWRLIGHSLPTCRYRDFVGEFASASAVAAALAAQCIEAGRVPGPLVGDADVMLSSEGRVLVLGTGQCLTAMEFFRP